MKKEAFAAWMPQLSGHTLFKLSRFSAGVYGITQAQGTGRRTDRVNQSDWPSRGSDRSALGPVTNLLRCANPVLFERCVKRQRSSSPKRVGIERNSPKSTQPPSRSESAKCLRFAAAPRPTAINFRLWIAQFRLPSVEILGDRPQFKSCRPDLKSKQLVASFLGELFLIQLQWFRSFSGFAVSVQSDGPVSPCWTVVFCNSAFDSGLASSNPIATFRRQVR